MGIITFLWEKITDFTRSVLFWFGFKTVPFWQWLEHHFWLRIFGSIGLLIVGIILITATKALRERAFADMDDAIEGIYGYYSLIVKVLYYPAVLVLTVLYIASSYDGNVVFGAALSGGTDYTCFNFDQWHFMHKFIMCYLLIYFLLRSLACVVRLKPLRLLKFWIHTVDFMIIGWVVANLYILMMEISSTNFLFMVLSLLPQFYMLLAYVYLITLFIAPILLILLPLAIPFVGVARLFLGLSPFFIPTRINNEADAAGYLYGLKNWVDVFTL